MRNVLEMTAEEYRRSWDPTEKEFQAELVSVAADYGYYCWHDNDSRRNDRGLPDLICFQPGKPLIFWECKTNRGRVRRDQALILATLAEVPGIISGVVRPRDWDSILTVLRESNGTMRKGSAAD